MKFAFWEGNAGPKTNLLLRDIRTKENVMFIQRIFVVGSENIPQLPYRLGVVMPFSPRLSIPTYTYYKTTEEALAVAKRELLKVGYTILTEAQRNLL